MADDFGCEFPFAGLVTVGQGICFWMLVFGAVHCIYLITRNAFHFLGLVTVQRAPYLRQIQPPMRQKIVDATEVAAESTYSVVLLKFWG